MLDTSGSGATAFVEPFGVVELNNNLSETAAKEPWDFTPPDKSTYVERVRALLDVDLLEIVDGKLILQGAEDGYDKMRDGLGWTMAISETTGQVVLTGSGEQVAFVIFGACIPF